ncbi:MAG: TIGR02611 family protein [Phycicoccus sp.]|nr:TIGR02611 family protein [Phycicoccus sp.]
MTEPMTAPGDQESDDAVPSRPVRQDDHGEHPEHLLRDADSPDDWAWRRAIRARRPLLLVYRGIILTLGFTLVGFGLVLVPLPGPGWLMVFLGLAVLASEFEPANRLLQFARAQLHQWNVWIKAQSRWVQVVVGVATFAFVCAVLWVTMHFSGVPAWLPDPIEDALVDVARLPRA